MTKPEDRGQTSHGLGKAASPGLLFHSCQHRPVKASAHPTCPLQSWPGKGDSLLLCLSGIVVPEAVMARMDASMQENKQVSSDPSWSILPTKPSQPPKRGQQHPNGLPRMDVPPTAFVHLEPCLGAGCISAT